MLSQQLVFHPFMADDEKSRNVEKTQIWTRNKILLTALAVRICLVLYSNVHDYMFEVNFTDIDYSVFSDAAQHVANGGSPYERATYRYTPALAWLLVPNTKFRDFGKYLFCVVDIVVAWLCYALCDLQMGKKNSGDSRWSPTVPLVVFWLVNPLTAVISARGNADCLVCGAVLLTLYWILQGKWILAALAHGLLAVHLKIYPVIYLPSIYLYYVQKDSGVSLSSIVCGTSLKNIRLSIFDRIKLLINVKGLLFIAISLISFSLAVLGFYSMYGDVFLEEFLLYHVKRRDIRHNFSPYFYILYLIDNDVFLSKVIGFIAFVPQIGSMIAFSLRFSRDPPFCWFLITFAFVSFNKVSTSQYFIWYIVFLPVIANRIKLSIRQSTFLVSLWFIGQGIWLFFAYLFEFKGYDTFLYIWLSSLLFLFINCYIIRSIIGAYQEMPTSVVHTVNKKK